MTRLTLLIQTAACVAAIAAAGAARAADGELSAPGQDLGAQPAPSCQASGVSGAPFGLVGHAPALSTRSHTAGGYTDPKDFKLVFFCPSRSLPAV
ncbi:hypothetical protein [Phenylobacterium sp. Root700]|uniref:hypothetical protein n=1 Tax=Phenylobacterium sp. Root700 TaxID=1736591 RepID=UPI0006F8E1FC|nr:hypothetical protein [Phenylobacterium sp. Root700]KRB40529.1 hypothetical protein ASE02_07455 [Phenylobacterium sp. Root700]